MLDRDMLSLKQHADFLSNKITMLLDTVVGLVSVEQNAIIKIFSVAAVGFMPPTLVASIYGMNFQVHAGAGMGAGLSFCAGADAAFGTVAVDLFPFQRLAIARSAFIGTE